MNLFCKIFLVYLGSCATSTTAYGQTSVVTTSNINIPISKERHTLNYVTKPSWGNQSFIDSVKTLNLELIRYPGGTESTLVFGMSSICNILTGFINMKIQPIQRDFHPESFRKYLLEY